MPPRSLVSTTAATALFLTIAAARLLAAQPAGAVAGRVTDTFGDPLAGVTVEAVSPSGYVETARTGPQGGYRLPPLVAGAYRVTFSRDGYTEQVTGIDVTAGVTTRLAVSLQPLIPTRIGGTVVDQQGLALPGALVEATAADGPPLAATTDGAGRFALGPLRPGRWQVTVTMPGFTKADMAVDIAFSEQANVRVPLGLDYALREEIVVVGSRRRVEQRTVTESPVPVDVFTADDLLTAQPRTGMTDLLRVLAPSLNIARQPIADGVVLNRPVTLRNLSPDHLLVLLNGRRRHRTPALAWLGGGFSQGSQGPDVSWIPAIAIRQVEMLRDGAGAQYGSDAVSGVINFELKDARQGGSVVLSQGAYLRPNSGSRRPCLETASTRELCDGIGGRASSWSFAGNHGLAAGSSGFVNLSLEYGGNQPTNTAVQPHHAADLAAGTRGALDPYAAEHGHLVRDTAWIWGRPRVDDDLKLFVNAALDPLRGFTPYGFFGAGRREVSGSMWYRHPFDATGVYTHASEARSGAGRPVALLAAQTLPGACARFPRQDLAFGPDGVPSAGAADLALASAAEGPGADCATFHALHPGGFAPRLSGILTDTTAAFGFRRVAPSGASADFSISTGRGRLVHRLSNTVNPSWGPAAAWDAGAAADPRRTPDHPYLVRAGVSADLASALAGSATLPAGHFRPGSSEQTEAAANADFTAPFGDDVHLAWGGQARFERYATGLGDNDPFSWLQGPYFHQPGYPCPPSIPCGDFNAGSNGLGGITPSVALGKVSRANLAWYADAEHRDPGERFTLAAAWRGEQFFTGSGYSDQVGLVNTFKAAGLWSLTERTSVRGAWSTSFRAPTPAQQHAFNVVERVVGDLVANLDTPDPGAVRLLVNQLVHGTPDPKDLLPERSKSFSAGLVHSVPGMQLAVDAYRIVVDDRVGLSPRVPASAALAFPAVRDSFLRTHPLQMASYPVLRFFRNEYRSATTGVDLTWTWQARNFLLGAAGNYTHTALEPAARRLAAGGLDPNTRRAFADRSATLERELPTHRASGWITMRAGPAELTARYTWYGSYWDSGDAFAATQCWRCALAPGEAPPVLPLDDRYAAYPPYDGRGLLDVDASWTLSDAVTLSTGVENVLAAVPDENPYAYWTVGNRYGQFSPFGFDGAYVYGRLHYAWDR